MLLITVADTGLGIEESDLSKIFLPFFTAKKTKGLGLGLPICERIVKNHGGEIAVKSSPGGGTTFSIRLPLHQSGNSIAPVHGADPTSDNRSLSDC
jgi:signal transduction histidine kinase